MPESYSAIHATLTDPRLIEVLRLADNVVCVVPLDPRVAERPAEYHERRSEMWGHVRKLVEYVGTILPDVEGQASTTPPRAG